MNKQPFFSIIVPLYNKEKYISKTLDSILEQTFKDYELIIINDGSNDNSLNIVKSYESKFEYSIIVTQENKGLSATRNRGISLAKGEVICLIDADDIWLNNYLNVVYELYEKFNEADVFGTNYLECYSKNNILETKKNIDKNLENNSFLIKDFFSANIYQSIICQSSIAFKNNILSEPIYNTNVDYAEDVDFYLKHLTKHKIAYKYSPLVIINTNATNQMTKIGILNKRLPNLDYFTKIYANKKTVLAYLDLKRFMYGIAYKLLNDEKNFNKMLTNLNLDNLTWKQKVFLKSPKFVVLLLKKIKNIMLKFNFRITTFN